MARGLIAVYILTNKPYGTLYVGVTNNLYRRMHEHREGLLPGFTKQHGLTRLVWWEPHGSIVEAIQREINLIERQNPRWDDLYRDLLAGAF